MPAEELAIEIKIADDMVIWNFGEEPISWIAMEAEEAEAFGYRFLECARLLDEKKLKKEKEL